MFIGQESIGKFLFAKEFAKAILCLNENKPCNKCKSCLELENSNNPDLTIIEPDGNNVKIEQIRELNKKVVEKPIVSTKKVYIINDGQNITKEAQNALLKTLEEPPEYVTIILITTSESAFLPTIKSRCTKINFNKLTKEEMLNILKNKYNYQNIADIVYKISNGSINKSIQVIERQSEFETINKTFSNLENTNIIDLINSKEEIFKDKEEINNILDYIITIFFEKIKQNVKYVECIEITEKTKERLRKNGNYDMTIDNFMLSIWEEING